MNRRRIRELSLTPSLTPSSVTRLSCGAERWELDIRSDVESVTRFSVIESKISLKNERRSRDAFPRYYWELGKGEGMENEENADPLAPRV